jgi:Mg2+ and Co2+ transporter CorA
MEIIQILIDSGLSNGTAPIDRRISHCCRVAGDLIARTTSFTGDSLSVLEDWLEQIEDDFHHKRVNLIKYGYHISVATKLADDVHGYVVPFINDVTALTQASASEVSFASQLRNIVAAASKSNDSNPMLDFLQTIGVEALVKSVESHSNAHYSEKNTQNEHYYLVFPDSQHASLKRIEKSFMKCRSRIEGLNVKKSEKMDEERNTLSYILTIVTVILFPITFYSGFFGMNFDNMKFLMTDDASRAIVELQPFSMLHGINLFYTMTFVSYSTIIILGFFMAGYFDFYIYNVIFPIFQKLLKSFGVTVSADDLSIDEDDN